MSGDENAFPRVAPFVGRGASRAQGGGVRIRENVHFYPDPKGLDFSSTFNCNSVLLTGRRHVLIDPGMSREWKNLKNRVRADGLDLADVGLILATHSHPDHLQAAETAAAELGARLVMSAKELTFLGGEGRSFYEDDLSEVLGGPWEPPAVELFTPVFSGPARFEGREFRLIDAPGHSPGGLCLHWPERGLLVVGDVYFSGTIGAYDYLGGNGEDMRRTVRILGGLRDVDLVLCGHGPAVEGRPEVFANYGLLRKELEEKRAAGLM
jgi:glyoxylase-like metal-dependent hydrolase (beta-lactamase superfamily II)